MGYIGVTDGQITDVTGRGEIYTDSICINRLELTLSPR